MRIAVFSLAISVSILTSLGEAQKVAICQKVDNMTNYPFWLIQGKSGRLYSPLSFANNYSSVTSVISDLRDFNSALLKRKIRLVIAQVPQTSLIYPNDINWSDSHIFNKYDALKDKLDFNLAQKMITDAGIPAVNLLNVLSLNNEKFFYLYDHHWTAAGSKKAALAIADTINKYSMLEKIDRVGIKVSESSNERVPGSYMATLKDNCGDPGDLGLETVRIYDFEKSNTDLLDDTNPSVILAGDSYATERFGLGQFLAGALQADVQNASISGGGQYDSIITYLISQQHISNPPKVIVWNFLGGLNDATSFRVMTAAAFGNCETPVARGVKEIELSQPSKKLYLFVKSKDASAKDLKISFLNNGVESESAYIKFSDRVKNEGQFYYTIPDGYTSIKMISDDIEGAKVCAMK